MKILHCCLAAFYIDNYSYQENILPKMHKNQGHAVSILASTETYLNNADLGYVKPSSYINENNIQVTRLPYQKWLPHFVMKKLRYYHGITQHLENFRPDIIFLHDAQFLSIVKIVEYVRKNREVKVFVDGHTDFINSGTNWVSKNIMHKIIYRWCIQKIAPYTLKFYGVLPVRVDFFKDVYGTPPDKTELLLMGADQSIIDLSNSDRIKVEVRSKFNIEPDDFLIVTGGKIDRRKNIHVLLRAVINLNLDKVKILVFGSINQEMTEEMIEYGKSNIIRFAGWADAQTSSKYFLASDLAFFPGTHSVLWEQAVGLGIPAVFKWWDGMQHVDVGGNCTFLKLVDEKTIMNTIESIIGDKERFEIMKKVSIEVGLIQFSYDTIAKRAIEG